MHLAIDRLWSEALKEVFVAISRVKTAHAHVALNMVAIAKQERLLFSGELVKRDAKVRTCCQFVSGVFCPVCLARSRRTVENDLPLALKYRLNTRRYASQARESERLQRSSHCFRLVGR